MTHDGYSMAEHDDLEHDRAILALRHLAAIYELKGPLEALIPQITQRASRDASFRRFQKVHNDRIWAQLRASQAEATEHRKARDTLEAQNTDLHRLLERRAAREAGS